MKITRNLQAITIVPIVLLALVSAYFSFDAYRAYRYYGKEHTQSLQVYALKALFVNIATERGLESIYLVDRNNSRVEKLLGEQQLATNSAINGIINFNAPVQRDAASYKLIEEIKKINEVRAKVAHAEIGFDSMYDYYNMLLNLIVRKLETTMIQQGTPQLALLASRYRNTVDLMKAIADERDIVTDLIGNQREPDRRFLRELFYKGNINPAVAPKLFNTPGSLAALKKSDTIKHALLQGKRIPVKPMEWFTAETAKIVALNESANALLDEIIKKIQREKSIELVKGIVLGLLFLLSLYLFYLYRSLIPFLTNTQGLEKLLDKTLEHATLEDTLDLKTTEGIEKAYHVLEKSIDKIEIEKRKAEKANAAKTIFLANMSHEIRTPINGIIGFTDLLKSSKLGEEEQEYVDIIHKSTNNLLEIINNILDLSKIESQKIEIEEILFSPAEEFENTVDVYMPKAGSNGINLSMYMDPGFDNYLLGDVTKIKEVLLNLISNAMKFTPKNGHIEVTIKKLDTENRDRERIYFEVRDSGIGMSKEEMADIFDAFSQADSTVTRKYGGTGLGLTISANYVNLMDGKLQVESVKGKGSRFYFTLDLKKEKPLRNNFKNRFKHFKTLLLTQTKENPLIETLDHYLEYVGSWHRVATFEEITDPALLEKSNLIIAPYGHLGKEELTLLKSLNLPLILVVPTPMRLKADIIEGENIFIVHEPLYLSKFGKILSEVEQKAEFAEVKIEEVKRKVLEQKERYHILVVEDNEINRTLINKILRAQDLDVTTVENGKEAVEARKSSDFDLIFMDIAMPVMDGVSATKAILEYEREQSLPHVPIVALTANALKGDREKFLNDGFDEYLPKPIVQKDILELLYSYHIPLKDEREITIDAEEQESVSAAAASAQSATERQQERILVYKKSKMETKIFEKVLSQLYDHIDTASNTNQFLDMIVKNDYKVIMVDNEITNLDFEDLFNRIEKRDNTAVLLFRSFDSIVDDQTRKDFDEVLINSADKVYLKLILDNYLKKSIKTP